MGSRLKKRGVFVLLVFVLMFAVFSSIFIVNFVGMIPPVSGSIVDSERFIDVLEEENVAVWMHGHIHSDHHQDKVRVEKFGTVFIDSGSIVRTRQGYRQSPPQSLYLIFENGKRKVTVKSRDHLEGEWNGLENKFSFYLNHPFQYHEDNLKIWVWSDSQPMNETHWKQFKEAFEDADGSMDPDMSLVLGDIVDHGTKEAYTRYLNYLEDTQLPVENYYELAGNHDFNPFFTGTHENYRELIENRLRYEIRRGNVLFVIMSDEKLGSSGEITQETYRWWKDKVKANQKDTNIITFAHHSLRGTTGKSTIGLLEFLQDPSRIIFLLLITPVIIGPIVVFEVSDLSGRLN